MIKLSLHILNIIIIGGSNLHCELQTASKHVVVVLHAALHHLQLLVPVVAEWEGLRVTGAVPGVHEGVMDRVGLGQGVEDRVLGADSVVRGSAGGAVVPGEDDHGPAVVEAGGEEEVVVVAPLHHGPHLGLPALQSLAVIGPAQVSPVWEPSV